MIMYLKAELFRLKKDSVLLIAPAIILIGYAVTTVLAGVGSHCTRVTLLSSSWPEQYCFIFKLAVFLLCHIWSQEFRNYTLKNVYTSGHGAGRFFLAKLATQFLVCILLMVWAILCFGFCCMTLKNGEGDVTVLLLERLKGAGVLLAYSFAELSVLDMMCLILKKEAIMFGVYFVVIDKIGEAVGAVTEASLPEKLSVGYGYRIATTLYLDSGARLQAFSVMILYVALTAIVTILLMKKGIKNEK